MAHSIKHEVQDEELEDMSSEAAYVANVLLQARNEVQRANYWFCVISGIMARVGIRYAFSTNIRPAFSSDPAQPFRTDHVENCGAVPACVQPRLGVESNESSAPIFPNDYYRQQ
jgi:hypothetical protein